MAFHAPVIDFVTAAGRYDAMRFDDVLCVFQGEAPPPEPGPLPPSTWQHLILIYLI